MTLHRATWASPSFVRALRAKAGPSRSSLGHRRCGSAGSPQVSGQLRAERARVVTKACSNGEVASKGADVATPCRLRARAICSRLTQ